MEIKVLWEDITAARAELAADTYKDNSYYCPISRALKREFSPDVWVYGDYFETLINGSIEKYDLPEVARTFVELFDNNKNVKPISFNISI